MGQYMIYNKNNDTQYSNLVQYRGHELKKYIAQTPKR